MPLSFSSRRTSVHTGGRLAPFLHDIGMQPLKLSGGDTEAVTRLCAIAGVSLAKVLENIARRLGKRRFDLRGHEITAEFLSSPDTVF